MSASQPEAEGPVLGPVLCLAVAQLVSWGSLYYAFALFIGPLEREMGWSRTEITGALTLGLLTTAAASPLAGRAIDRFGGRLPMSAGSLGATLLLLAWAAVDRLLLFYLVWIGLGATMAFVLYDAVFAPLARTLVATYRRAVTVVTLLAGFASTVFFPLVHFAIAAVGWRGALVLLAFLDLAISGSAHLFVPPRHGPARRRAGDPRFPAPTTAGETARGWSFRGILVAVVANATSVLREHLPPGCRSSRNAASRSRRA